MSPQQKKKTTRAITKAEADNDAGHERARRDWMGMLIPILITIFLSIVANVGTAIWQGATFKSQVNSIDAHQKIQDEAIKENSDALHTILNRLPIDYIPRAEIEETRQRNKELRDREDARMTAIEGKLDRLLERSSGR